MTTVAWDGTTLAADCQSTDGRGVMRISHKIYEGDLAVFAGCGAIDELQQIARYLVGGGERPAFTADEMFGFLFERATGQIFAIQGRALERLPLAETQHACGSGSSFALGAMAAGATAEQAVVIASRFDCATGLGCDSIRPDVDPRPKHGKKLRPYRMVGAK